MELYNEKEILLAKDAAYVETATLLGVTYYPNRCLELKKIFDKLYEASVQQKLIHKVGAVRMPYKKHYNTRAVLPQRVEWLITEVAYGNKYASYLIGEDLDYFYYNDLFEQSTKMTLIAQYLDGGLQYVDVKGTDKPKGQWNDGKLITYTLPETEDSQSDTEASQPAPEDEFDEEALIEMLMELDAGTSRATSRTSHLLFEEDYWDEDIF